MIEKETNRNVNRDYDEVLSRHTASLGHRETKKCNFPNPYFFVVVVRGSITTINLSVVNNCRMTLTHLALWDNKEERPSVERKLHEEWGHFKAYLNSYTYPVVIKYIINEWAINTSPQDSQIF